ncbi:MAG TPA: cystathionine beta-lyase [Aestuariivirgaceae bacterium]|jgi:cystathionine beta-lyase
MAKQKTNLNKFKPETRLVVAARDYSEHGIVNPAVYHASTILFPTMQDYLKPNQPYVYGRRGNPTSRALEAAIAQIEEGHDTRVCSSGLSAITTALLAFLKSGDHLLITDAVYGPVRRFCDTILPGLGIEVTYYEPRIGARMSELMRSNTKVVYAESPGSLTMEVQDIPAIAEAAHRRGALLMCDNTWSAGYFFKAFQHGCDISVQSATKYLGGHSDLMLGSVTCSDDTWPQFKEVFGTLGQFAGPDDMYLALRGLRTLDVRLERHMRNALIVADWLRSRSEVEEVFYPALPGSPGHDLWKRDFRGASGLFSAVLRTSSSAAAAAMLDGLELFGMGDSWGGYESLVVPFDPRPLRSATPWPYKGVALRFHIGLENTDDLKADLAEGFKRLISAG